MAKKEEMKEGTYRGKPVFTDLIDSYEGIPMSTIIKLVNDAKPKTNGNIQTEIKTNEARITSSP